MQLWRITRSLTNPRTTNCGKFSRACQRNTECSPTVAVSGRKRNRWMMRKQPYWHLLRAPVRSAGSRGMKLLPAGAAALSDMSCVDGTRAHSVVCESLAVSPGFGGAALLTNSSELSGGSCGKDTHPAEHTSLTQPAIQAPPAHFVTSRPDVFTGVELVSRATYISRKRRATIQGLQESRTGSETKTDGTT